MRVGSAHLTYCTNIHPAETWPEVRANLERYVVAVKASVAPDEPFGVGLRLSGRAANELAGSELAAFRRWLDATGLYVFTINGFPHGAFHGTPVKADVYRPDWLEPERVAYTNKLADLLAELLPDGVDGTISTVPGCFRARVTAGSEARMAEQLARCTDHFAALEQRSGRHITLALEPEPCCSMETTVEAVAFLGRIADRRHLGVCLDACHAAVEFEDLSASVAALAGAGIAVAKVQLGCGLRVAPVGESQRAALARFAEGVYLHQVVARRGAELLRYVDLPEALAAPIETDEWRVHFHVPIFRAELGEMGSTQPFLEALLAAHKRAPISTHLEVETYTWDVLPPEFRDEPIVDAIARELRWVLERLR